MDPKKWIRPVVTLSHEQLEQIEDYRRTQTPIPNRSEAIRQLIGLGLKAAQKPTKRK